MFCVLKTLSVRSHFDINIFFNFTSDVYNTNLYLTLGLTVFNILVILAINFRPLIPVAERLSCGSAASRLLELRVRIPPSSWTFCLVTVVCC